MFSSTALTLSRALALSDRIIQQLSVGLDDTASELVLCVFNEIWAAKDQKAVISAMSRVEGIASVSDATKNVSSGIKALASWLLHTGCQRGASSLTP